MKLKTVLFNKYRESDNKVLTSLCEYDTDTKTKKYISIPNHIASLIIDPSTKRVLTPTLTSYELVRELSPYYQD